MKGFVPSPRSMDLSAEPLPITRNIVITEGDEKGKVYLVIYKFEDGQMVQCMQLDNQARPKTFTGKAGSGCALEIWQKEKTP